MNAWKNYENHLRQYGWKINPKIWIILSIIISTGFGIASFFTITFLKLPVSPLLSLIVFVVFLDLFAGYPYFKAEKRIELIEQAFPDALKQMADTLKAGGTYEYALREITNAEYGPLTDEMEIALRRIEEGGNLENSLLGFSNNIDSRLIKRTVNIIIDSIKAGAGLANVLDEIADDIREMNRLKEERKSSTLMQAMFMVAAGAFVAPFIFGLVSSIIAFFIETAASGLNLPQTIIQNSLNAKELIVNLMQFYVLIEAIAIGAMLAIMRNGKITKSIIYIPMLLLIAYFVFYASAFLGSTLVGGA